MNLDRTLTSSVYVVFNNKVLLHMHKKHKSLFPLGGHMMSNEVPHETAIREVLEESGLDVELYNDEKAFDMGRVIQLKRPLHVLLENVGREVENIDFIYFGKALHDNINPQFGESKELYWFNREEIENSKDIKPHIKSMALEALNTIK